MCPDTSLGCSLSPGIKLLVLHILLCLCAYWHVIVIRLGCTGMYLGLQKSKINLETKVLVSCGCLTLKNKQKKKLSLSTENNKESILLYQKGQNFFHLLKPFFVTRFNPQISVLFVSFIESPQF